MKLRKNRKKGFTLIELIVVIAILGILAAILIPQFTGFQEQAREKAALAEARSVATALDSYYALNGNFNTTTTALVTAGFITSDLAANTVLDAANDGGFVYTADNGKTAGRLTTEAVSSPAPTNP